MPIPGTNYKRSNNLFAVTSIALITGHDWPRLVQLLAQSLIWSPGTRGMGRPRKKEKRYLKCMPSKSRLHCWCLTLFNHDRYGFVAAFFYFTEWLKVWFIDLYLYLIFWSSTISLFWIFCFVISLFFMEEICFLDPTVLHSSQNSYWDCYGSFDEQGLFSVKFARFRNFFDFAQIWGILQSDKLWEIQCWRVADGKDESWQICVVRTTFGIATYCKVIFLDRCSSVLAS